MATRAKLHGRPLQVALRIAALYAAKHDKNRSHRSCRKELAGLVHELATQTNVEPRHFADYVPPRIVEAIARERTKIKLVACGVLSMDSTRTPRRRQGARSLASAA